MVNVHHLGLHRSSRFLVQLWRVMEQRSWIEEVRRDGSESELTDIGRETAVNYRHLG
jgi:uncharacterized protein YjiS (DUF1127 family)